MENSADVYLANIVIYDIYKTYNHGNVIGLKIRYCTDLDARNMIIYYIRKSLYQASAYGVSQLSSTYTFDYSDVYYCSTGLYDNVTQGDNCLSLNPHFLDLSTRNFRLHASSPCINTGDPLIKDPDGTESDMGAYGGPGGLW